MNTRALTATLLMLALAACTSTPSPSGTLAVTPTGTPPPTAPSTATVQPSLPPTPTLIPTLEPTGTPTAPPTATPTIAPTATPTVAPSPTPSASPTAPPAWPAADRIARGSFTEPTIAVDGAGSVHIAAAGTGTDNRGIWYLTNATGRWVKQLVVTPWYSEDSEEIGRVDGPAIAIDPSDGSVWIAFIYWECPDCIPNSSQGVYYVTNAGGRWTAPVLLTDDSLSTHLSVAVRGGKVYLAWHSAGDYVSRGGIGFGTNASGLWTEQQIAAAGVGPHLVIDPQGRVAILFGAKGDVRYARQKQSGDFAVERLPTAAGISAKWAYSILAIDGVTGDKWAAWNVPTDDQGNYDVYVAARGPDGWSNPLLATSGGTLVGLGVHDGVVQMAAGKSGLTYASNASSAFVEQVIDGSSAYWGIAALALGPTGRPYVVFCHDVDSGGQFGVWFLEGPGG